MVAEGVETAGLPRPAQLLIDRAGDTDSLHHVELIPGRDEVPASWPAWVDPDLVAALEGRGLHHPWQHQVRAADAAWAGRSVVISTGTASGKSLAYLLPILTAARPGRPRESARPTGPGRAEAAGRPATALYIAPTKALAADQLAAVHALGDLGVRVATFDGDTPVGDRRWIREHATFVLTNPDMLHHAILPRHTAWRRFLGDLGFVVLDECHHYRGVFGAHVAALLRRLRRLAEHHGADPTFVLSSATSADPAGTARSLLNLDVEAVTEDTSPRSAAAFLLWQPALTSPAELRPHGDVTPGAHAPSETTGRAAPTRPPSGSPDPGNRPRRSALSETADLLAELVAMDVATLAFVPSRRGAETVAADARHRLTLRGEAARNRVASYRGGYLPEERRKLEARLRSGELRGLATTNALELGIDVSGLDAVLICGWPGRLASLWQQAGRAGRRGNEAVAVLVARDDPLDTYLLRHPEVVFRQPVEATVLDPDNPYVLAPHLCAAASELPLRPADLALFGPGTKDLVDVLVRRGALRARPTGWYWTSRSRATDLVDLRGTGGAPVRIVEATTGTLIGTVDHASSHRAVHPGAVYVHQGASYVVRELDLEAGVALVDTTPGELFTQAREVTDVRILGTRQATRWGPVDVAFGPVEVTSRVVSFRRREVVSGRVLGEEPLDLPERTLRTCAVWWAVPQEILTPNGIPPRSVPGATHAMEHAAIGLLPLLAACDRWDVGGVSTALHPDTGRPTVVVHDAHPGGAGFAQRGFHTAASWLSATRAAIHGCPCSSGCPACIHSPKCGNGNEPLDKAAAVRLLDVLLSHSGT